MPYHQDWFMRQIEALITFLIYFATGERTDVQEVYRAPVQAGELHKTLQKLIERGELCQAEDILFDVTDGTDLTAFDAALRFYQQINCLSDRELEVCNFSRSEIVDGIREICARYSIPDDILAMFLGAW